MTGTVLATLLGAALFAAFVIGWAGHWLWARLARAASPVEDRVRELAAELLHVEAERDEIRQAAAAREAELTGAHDAREAELTQALREREAELAAAMETVAALRGDG